MRLRLTICLCAAVAALGAVLIYVDRPTTTADLRKLRDFGGM